MNVTSVDIAKDRIKALLVSDRVNCTPDTFEKIQSELYKTITKKFQVKLNRSYIYIQLTGEDS